EYFEDFLKKCGLLDPEQQTEEQRRLAGELKLNFGWLRGAYVEWLAACQQFTEEIDRQSTDVRPETCGGSIRQVQEGPISAQAQRPPSIGFGVLHWWQRAEQQRRDELERCRRDEQRQAREAQERARAEQQKRRREEMDAARRRRQEENARKD